jgi:hypothetical protein
VRAPGEINGKSANVNNCLKNVIYPEYEGHWGDIPLTELVVVFDADMAAKKNFFLKVGTGKEKRCEGRRDGAGGDVFS